MRWVVLLALLATAAWTQSPAAAPPSDDVVVAVFQSARAALADVPDAARPLDRLALAEAEDIRHPRLALDDYAQAFREAVALPRSADTTAISARWIDNLKLRVEKGVIQALTQWHGTADFTLAHQLVRSADIRRAPLYDLLIASAAEQAGSNYGPRRVPESSLLFQIYGAKAIMPRPQRVPIDIDPPYDVVALIEECRQADGSFPYQGALTALTTYRAGGVAPLPVLRLAMQAAASETDLQSMGAATALLSQMHYFVPALDNQMESTIADMLAHVAALSPSGIPGVNRQLIGSNLLALLHRMNSDRVQELTAQYSALATPPDFARRPAPPTPSNIHTADPDPFAAFTQAEALPANTDPERWTRFRALVQAANDLAATHPTQARLAAGDAVYLLREDRVRGDLLPVELLALHLATDMDDTAAAHEFLLPCLMAADKIAQEAEDRYDHADPDRRLLAVNGIAGGISSAADTFAFAARMDFPLALQRAQQTPATYFRPLFLTRVAVGRELLHPWWK